MRGEFDADALDAGVRSGAQRRARACERVEDYPRTSGLDGLGWQGQRERCGVLTASDGRGFPHVAKTGRALILESEPFAREYDDPFVHGHVVGGSKVHAIASVPNENLSNRQVWVECERRLQNARLHAGLVLVVDRPRWLY